jgi:hypothetical protein
MAHELDPNYHGSWECEDDDIYPKGTLIEIRKSTYEVKVSGDPHGSYSNMTVDTDKVDLETTIGVITLRRDGSGAITEKTPSTRTTVLKNKGKVNPSKSDSKGGKSDDTPMMLILGLAIVGLFGFNKVF